MRFLNYVLIFFWALDSADAENLWSRLTQGVIVIFLSIHICRELEKGYKAQDKLDEAKAMKKYDEMKFQDVNNPK